MSSVREIIESPIEIGSGETYTRPLDTTKWGGTPSSPSVTLYRQDGPDTLTDVSATNLTGSASVQDDYVYLPTITGLTAGKTYKIVVSMVIGGDTLEAYGWIKATT